MTRTLADGLWQIDCRSRDRPNAYVVADGDVTLVDAGWPTDAETVRSGLADAGFELADVDRVLVTHYDVDHIGSLGQLAPPLDAPVFVHRLEAPYVAGEARPPWTARCGLEAFHRLYYRHLTLPDLPVKSVEDGDEVGGFRVYHAPGHTPGHVAYVHEGVGAAFIGDLAYVARGELRAPGRLTSYDAGQNAASLGAFADRAPAVEYLCPGHGRALDDGRARLRRATA